MEIFYGKLKSWEQVKKESSNITDQKTYFQVWHPSDRYLQVYKGEIKFFGTRVRAKIRFETGSKVVYDVGKVVDNKWTDNWREEFVAYDYWFEYITKEKPQQLPDHLFEI